MNNTIVKSITVDYKGTPVTIKNGKVYVYKFGTTIYNQSMHYSLVEMPQDNMKDEFKQFLKSNNLI